MIVFLTALFAFWLFILFLRQHTAASRRLVGDDSPLPPQHKQRWWQWLQSLMPPSSPPPLLSNGAKHLYWCRLIIFGLCWLLLLSAAAVLSVAYMFILKNVFLSHRSMRQQPIPMPNPIKQHMASLRLTFYDIDTQFYNLYAKSKCFIFLLL